MNIEKINRLLARYQGGQARIGFSHELLGAAYFFVAGIKKLSFCKTRLGFDVEFNYIARKTKEGKWKKIKDIDLINFIKFPEKELERLQDAFASFEDFFMVTDNFLIDKEILRAGSGAVELSMLNFFELLEVEDLIWEFCPYEESAVSFIDLRRSKKLASRTENYN